MNQKAILFATVSLCALVAMAGPVRAQEVTPPSIVVTADVTKTQDITVNEFITKTKTVDITVHAPIDLDGAAEATTVAEQHNINVHAGIATQDTTAVPPNTITVNDGLQRTAAITSSINANTGIVGVNQDTGDFANQANIVSFALTNTLATSTASPNRGSVADAKAVADQSNEKSDSTDIENFVVTANRRDNSITDSVDGNHGIVGVNQNSGNANNQLNGVALAVGQGAAVALSEAALGQENSNLRVVEASTTRGETILRSVNGNFGITEVNQSNGNFNNQGSVVSISALTSSVTLGSSTFNP